MIKVDNRKLVELRDIYFVSVDGCRAATQNIFFGVPEFVCARILRRKGELNDNTVIAPFTPLYKKP